MEAILEEQFLKYSAEKLRQYTDRIGTSVAKLNPEQIWARGGENENAVGNLILHLCGNVRQWIVSGVGGQPDTRQRDTEFDARGGASSAELMERLRQTIGEAVAVIETVPRERLADRLLVQQYPVSVLEAIYHVVEHFSMHTGQILFVTKMLSGADLGFYKHLRTTAAHGHNTP